MSLLKLLATGRSLVGMRNTNSPYRMRAGQFLPKFGSPKNPFAPPPPASADAPAPSVEPALPGKETGSLFDPPITKDPEREPAPEKRPRWSQPKKKEAPVKPEV